MDRGETCQLPRDSLPGWGEQREAAVRTRGPAALTCSSGGPPRWGRTAPWEQPPADSGPFSVVARTGRCQEGFPIWMGDGEGGWGRGWAGEGQRPDSAPKSHHLPLHRPVLLPEPPAPPAAGKSLLRDAFPAPHRVGPSTALKVLSAVPVHTQEPAISILVFGAELHRGLGLYPRLTIWCRAQRGIQ